MTANSKIQNSYLIQICRDLYITPKDSYYNWNSITCILDLEATGRSNGKWPRPDGGIKNTWRQSSLMGRSDGYIGRPNGDRAKSLCPFFSRGAFRRACRRDFRWGSRVSWRLDGLRTVSERCSQVLVLEFLTASRPDGYESRPDACTSLALFFPFCSRTLANTSN
jgi:hypothetical protein